MLRSRKRSEEVAQAMIKNIQNDIWKPGDKLPSIVELMKHYGVSRSTIRDALLQLEGRGYVRLIHGEGTFVQEKRFYFYLPTLKQEERLSICSMMRARLVIESAMAEEAARFAKPSDVFQMRQIISVMVSEQKADGQDSLFKYDLSLHRLIAQSTHNDVLLKLFDTFSGSLRLVLHAVHDKAHHDSERLQMLHADHQAIVGAIEQKDGRLARQAMRHHLERVYVWLGCEQV